MKRGMPSRQSAGKRKEGRVESTSVIWDIVGTSIESKGAVSVSCVSKSYTLTIRSLSIVHDKFDGFRRWTKGLIETLELFIVAESDVWWPQSPWSVFENAIGKF